MEKNRIRPVKAGKGIRMSYSRQKEVLEMPEGFLSVVLRRGPERSVCRYLSD